MSSGTEHEVRRVLAAWATAVRDADADGALAQHCDDVVLFDVPPPLEVTGLPAYRRQWELFWAAQGPGEFDLSGLTVVAGEDVAYAHGVITVGAADPATHFPVRLTVGLRRVDGRWLVAHEHHSVPAS